MEVDFQAIESETLSSKSLAIVGLGLMGGSLGLALRGRFKQILGCDINSDAIQKAVEIGAIDEGGTDPHLIYPRADVIVYAAPVERIIEELHQLPQHHPGNAIIMDLGSTKKQIVNAMQALPERLDPIGGHPMCGKEKSGIDYADAELYSGAPFALVPLNRTSDDALALASAIAKIIGAHELWLDASTHDAWVAKTSHLPYLISAALASTVYGKALQLAGSGFNSMARLAGSDKTMMLDIIRSNRENISKEISKFQVVLDLLHTALVKEQYDEIETIINYGRATYHEINSAAVKGIHDEVEDSD